MTTSASLPRPPALDDATQKLVDELRGAYRDPENGVVVVSPRLLVRAADALEAAQRPPVSKDDPIPRYAQLDVWMALFGAERSEEYEPFREEHGFAETWAWLLAQVRQPPVNPEVPDDAVIEAMARALNPFAWKVRDKYMSHPDHEALELDVMVEDSIRQARAAYAALRGAIQ